MTNEEKKINMSNSISRWNKRAHTHTPEKEEEKEISELEFETKMSIQNKARKQEISSILHYSLFWLMKNLWCFIGLNANTTGDSQERTSTQKEYFFCSFNHFWDPIMKFHCSIIA